MIPDPLQLLYWLLVLASASDFMLTDQHLLLDVDLESSTVSRVGTNLGPGARSVHLSHAWLPSPSHVSQLDESAMIEVNRWSIATDPWPRAPFKKTDATRNQMFNHHRVRDEERQLHSGF